MPNRHSAAAMGSCPHRGLAIYRRKGADVSLSGRLPEFHRDTLTPLRSDPSLRQRCGVSRTNPTARRRSCWGETHGGRVRDGVVLSSLRISGERPWRIVRGPRNSRSRDGSRSRSRDDGNSRCLCTHVRAHLHAHAYPMSCTCLHAFSLTCGRGSTHAHTFAHMVVRMSTHTSAHTPVYTQAERLQDDVTTWKNAAESYAAIAHAQRHSPTRSPTRRSPRV